MLIAHLPSGYLPGRATSSRGPVLWTALAGSVAPDLDMIWFYLSIPPRITTGSGRISRRSGQRSVVALPLIRRPASAAIFLHLALDTIGGGIMWAWPFSNHLFELVTVPARQSHWILSFVLHWTFLAEIAICTAALIVMRKPADKTADKATATG